MIAAKNDHFYSFYLNPPPSGQPWNCILMSSGVNNNKPVVVVVVVQSSYINSPSRVQSLGSSGAGGVGLVLVSSVRCVSQCGQQGALLLCWESNLQQQRFARGRVGGTV